MNLPDGSFISDDNAAYHTLELTWPCSLTAASCVTSQFHAAQLGPLYSIEPIRNIFVRLGWVYMDQTGIAFVLGLIFGAPLGAFLLRWFTGWTSWLAFLGGALIGLVLVTVLAYLLIEYSVKVALGLFVGAPLGAVILGWITGWVSLLALIGGAGAGLALFTVWGHFIEIYSSD